MKNIIGIGFLTILAFTACSPAAIISNVLPYEFTDDSFDVTQTGKSCQDYDLKPSGGGKYVNLKSTDQGTIEYTADKGISMGFEVNRNSLVICAYATQFPIPNVKYAVQIRGQVNEYKFAQTVIVYVRQGKRYFGIPNNWDLTKNAETCKPVLYSEKGFSDYTGLPSTFDTSGLAFINKTGLSGQLKVIDSITNLCINAGAAIIGSHNAAIYGHINDIGVNDSFQVEVPR